MLQMLKKFKNADAFQRSAYMHDYKQRVKMRCTKMKDFAAGIGGMVAEMGSLSVSQQDLNEAGKKIQKFTQNNFS